MSVARPLRVGARDGEFGKSWTRVIGRANFWFRVADTPVGRRVMVLRIPLHERYAQRYVHTLYNCDPAAFEEFVAARFARPAREGDA